MNERTSVSPLKAVTRVAELLIKYYDGSAPTFRMVDAAASSAKFPITWVNGRRYVAEDDLPKIAAVFGMTPKSLAKASRKAASAPVSASIAA